MNIPTEEDWGDLSDFDKADAFKEFFGKSNQDMQQEYKRNIYARCSDFYEMPVVVLSYYIYGLADFIEHTDYWKFPSEQGSAISCLFNLFDINFEKNHSIMSGIFYRLFNLMKDISDNQEHYGLDEDIYGNFNEKLKKIESIVKMGVI